MIRWFNPSKPMYQMMHPLLWSFGFHQWVLLIKAWLQGQKSLGCGEVKKRGPRGTKRIYVPFELFMQSQAYHHLPYFLSYSEGSQLELSLCMNKGARFSSSHYFIFHGTSLELKWWY